MGWPGDKKEMLLKSTKNTRGMTGDKKKASVSITKTCDICKIANVEHIYIYIYIYIYIQVYVHQIQVTQVWNDETMSCVAKHFWTTQ